MGHVFAHDRDTRTLICAIQEKNWGSPSWGPFIRIRQSAANRLDRLYLREAIRKTVSSRLLWPAVERRMNNILDLGLWAPRDPMCIKV